jgi:uncharacterized RDD family membrane protein YckC
MAERLAASRLATVPAGPDHATDSDRASVPIRIYAYVLDSFVLFAFTMLFAALAGFSLFVRTDSGQEGITTTDEWLAIGICFAALPVWLVAMVMLETMRGQTLGQYVAGLHVVTEDGSKPGAGRLTAYWLALHPLAFHPMFGAAWLLLALASLLSELVVVVSLAMALLCFVAPVAALIFTIVDPQRRAIHDRLAGLKVVRLE